MNQINGTGSIFYNNSKKRWAAQYIVEENGITKKKCIYGKTRDIVNKRLTEIMYNYHNDAFVRENGIPLVKVLKQNREDKYAANLISDSHYNRLEFVIKELDRSPIGNMDIDKITTRDLQDYFNSLIERYTNSTIKKIWEFTKQGFEIAIDEKYIVSNPFRKVLKPKSRIPTKIVDALTVNEQVLLTQYLLESNISVEKYRAVLLIELYSGMRIGEVLALTPSDINFKERKIYVRKTIAYSKDGDLVVKHEPKTAAGRREIPLDYILDAPIIEQIQNMISNENDLLFTFEGRIIKASTINTVLKRICKNLGLRNNITNHTLRHTFGTRCVESGMTPVVVQRAMGHQDIKVTLNTYTSVLTQFQNAEFNKVGNYYLNNNIIKKSQISDNQMLLDKDGYYLREDLEDTYDNESGVTYTENGIILDLKKMYRLTKEQQISLFKDEEEYNEEIKKCEIILNQFLEKKK